MAPSAVDKTPKGIIDEIGFGWAQITVLLLGAGGVLCSDGAGLQAMNLSVTDIVRQFGISTGQGAFLPTSDLLGIMVGTVASANCGDIVGRQSPILFGYFGIFLFAFMSAVQSNFFMLAGCRILFGVSVGFALPPALALTNEMTPERWRMPMRVASHVAFPLGQLMMVLLAWAAGDSNLAHVSWHRELILYAPLPLVLFLFACRSLPESPIFLASVGLHAEAKEELRKMAELNKAEVSFEYSEASEAALPAQRATGASHREMSIAQRIAVIGSERYLRPTASLAFVTFVFNLTVYGQIYSAAQVLPTVSSLPAAKEMALTSTISLCMIVPIFFLSTCFTRRLCLILANVFMLLAGLLFDFASVQTPPRSLGYEAAFQLGTIVGPLGMMLGGTIIYQVAVEIFPPKVAITGAAIIISCGRVGAILAPLSFEGVRSIFGHWDPWFLMVAFLQLLAVILLSMTTVQAYSPEDEADMEALLPEDKIGGEPKEVPNTGYGAAAGA